MERHFPDSLISLKTDHFFRQIWKISLSEKSSQLPEIFSKSG